MSILIGHARGGDPTYTPGDQTLNEVRTQSWYSHSAGWDFVARFKDRTKAHKAALFCRAACDNQHIGYGQTTRNQLRPLARAANWNAAAITTDCNCDCTSFVCVCAEAGGVNMEPTYTYGNAPYSENIRQKLASTNEFEILTEKKYLTSDQYLMEGDILVNEPVATGHAVMSLENGSSASTSAASPAVSIETPVASIKNVKATEPAYYFDNSLKGQYETTVSKLSLRNGAGTQKKELTQIPIGAKVYCYGYYNTVSDEKWLFVQTQQGNAVYEAFTQAAYLRRI